MYSQHLLCYPFYHRDVRIVPSRFRHIDGNHKLIEPWGFVIHGGIDGYSRLCTYLRCSTSNRANVVLHSFEEAVGKYGCPEHIRCDYGTENYMVARYMLENRGLDRGSVITGMSTHNQRIERLWRDVRESATFLFSEIFFYMERSGRADRYNLLHLYAMRFVFCPRINRALEEFTNQWNNHPVRTEHNATPNMMWIRGLQAEFVLDGEVNTVDDDAPVPDIVSSNDVQVPVLPFELTEQDEVQL